MKYLILVLSITVVIYSNSIITSLEIGYLSRYNKSEQLLPKQFQDSFTLLGGKRISMVQLDSIIDRLALESMQNARKRGFIDTTKQK